MDSRRFPHEHVATASDDVTAEQIAALADLFPGAVIEGKVDFEALRALLGEAVETRPERYAFTWAGKREAMRQARATSTATLVPEPEKSTNWETTRNLFIEGDNLEVLKLLHRAYFGRVKMIYIDPPYNTGNDFVYPDDYADPLRRYEEITGQRDAEGNRLSSNAETSGRYHSNWLTMMYPRLALARSFLREDGLIFVSIDDTEAHNLRMLMNEVFGEENFVAELVWKKAYGGGPKTKYVVDLHEYVICYAKSLFGLEAITVPTNADSIARYYRYKDAKYDTLGPYRLHPVEATKSMGARPNLVFPIQAPDGSEIWPKRQWWWSPDRVQEALRDDMLVFTRNSEGWTVSYKQYLYDDNGDMRTAKPFSILEGPYTQQGTAELQSLLSDSKIFPFPKPTGVIRKLLEYVANDKDALILDFFAGSATTAQAVLELNREDGGNRRFIMVQLPERTGNPEFPTIAEIGKERIRRVIARMKREDAGKLDLSTRETPEDLGFRVFRYSASSVRQWRAPDRADGDAYLAQLELMVDPTERAKASARLLWEAAIREGYALTSRVEQVARVTGNAVYQVTDDDKEQSFFLCLDETVRLEALRPLRLTQSDLFICRDGAVDDSTGANLALQCRLKTL